MMIMHTFPYAATTIMAFAAGIISATPIATSMEAGANNINVTGNFPVDLADGDQLQELKTLQER